MQALRYFSGSDPTTMQLLQQQQLMQNINTDPMSSILAQQMAQLQMQQQLTFQQPLTYPSVSYTKFKDNLASDFRISDLWFLG